jgi:hypothetical protein
MIFKKLFFSLLLLTSAGIAESQKVTSKKNPVISKPVITVPGIKMYKNDSLRISLNYPEDLPIVDKSKNKDRDLYVEFGENITLRNVKQWDSGPEYTNVIAKALRKDLSEFDTSYTSYSTFGAKRWFDFVSSYKSQAGKKYIRMLVYEASSGNVSGCYSLTIECNSVDYEKYANIARVIAGSLNELPAITSSYSNKKLKISFKHPSDWRIDNTGSTLMLFVKSSIKISDQTFFFGGYESNSTLKEIAEKEIAFFSQKNLIKKDYFPIGQNEFISKGKKIYLVSSTYLNPSDKPYIAYTYILTYIENGISKPFKIECSFPVEQDKKYIPYFEEFIKSIEFIK